MTQSALTPGSPPARKRFSATAREVELLIHEHYNRNEPLFLARAQALASRMPPDQRDAVLRHAQYRYGQYRHGLQVLPPSTQGLVHVVTPTALADLVLELETVETLHTVAREYRARTHLASRQLRPRNRLIFAGPPGNGKTSAAAALGTLVGAQTYVANLSQLIEQYMGASAKNLHHLFAVLSAGHILVLDEIDAVGSHRTSAIEGAGREYNLVVSTLLTLLDQEPNGMLIATTNRLDMLDTALCRRFDETLTFPGPTPEQAQALQAKLAQRYGVDMPGEWTEPESFDAVTKAVLRAAREAALAEWTEEKEAQP